MHHSKKIFLFTRELGWNKFKSVKVRVNQHGWAGWMVCGWETIFHPIPVNQNGGYVTTICLYLPPWYAPSSLLANLPT
jgi:hypothetical protein